MNEQLGSNRSGLRASLTDLQLFFTTAKLTENRLNRISAEKIDWDDAHAAITISRCISDGLLFFLTVAADLGVSLPHCAATKVKLDMGGELDELEADFISALAEVEQFVISTELHASKSSESDGEWSEPTSNTNVTPGADVSNGLPAQYRSKGITKQLAAKLLGQHNPDSGVKWLNACIDDGTITCIKLTRQRFVFDLRQFPANKHRYMTDS